MVAIPSPRPGVSMVAMHRRVDKNSWERLTTTHVTGGPQYSYLDKDVSKGSLYEYEIESVRLAGAGKTFGPVSVRIPLGVNAVLSPYPNPSTSDTKIHYILSGPGEISLRVFNVAGRLVRVFAEDEYRSAGPYEIAWNGQAQSGKDLPAGVYFIRLDTEQGFKTRRLVLLP